jgi:hypothetical protein
MSDVLPLTYDTLPPFSNLRREFDEDGHLRISVAAGEPGTLARRAAMYGTAWISVIWSIIITSLLLALLFPMIYSNQVQYQWLQFVLFISGGVFFSAMFLLVWWLEFRKRMDEIERAAMQMTVIDASPDVLMIESVGPFGKVSTTINHPFRIRRHRMTHGHVECLQAITSDGHATEFFPGLSNQELLWIASEILRATRVA